MTKIQTQGVHHITFVGSNREAIIDFYQGLLGMPLVFEQPNLDVPEENHLYFDSGDGRLITFFVRPTRTNDPTPNPQGIGNLHHLAFNVSRATYPQVAERLNEHGIENTGPIDRGFMDSIYFRDPNGQLLEMASSVSPTCWWSVSWQCAWFGLRANLKFRIVGWPRRGGSTWETGIMSGWRQSATPGKAILRKGRLLITANNRDFVLAV